MHEELEGHRRKRRVGGVPRHPLVGKRPRSLSQAAGRALVDLGQLGDPRECVSLEHRHEQLVLPAEVPVDRARGVPGTPSNLRQGSAMEPVVPERLRRRRH